MVAQRTRTSNGQLGFRLAYDAKQPEDQILRSIRPGRLETIRSYGEQCEGWANRLILGDNLPALHFLLNDRSIHGAVRLVYIDPPYATNRTFETKSRKHAYSDHLDGEDYLEFIRRRLILLRDLLAPDGSIYIHLDQTMAFAVKLIMDEVFGPSSFRNWITRKKCHSKNYTRNQYGNTQDFILYYAKGKRPVWNRPYEEGSYTFEQRFPHVEPNTSRRYALVPIHARGTRNGATGQPWRGMKPPPGKHWQYTPDKLDAFDARGEIYWSPKGNPRKKVYADQVPGVPMSDIWLNFKDERNQMIDLTGYPTEKNIELLRHIVRTSSNPGDLVVDCFCGSGTTLFAAAELGRRWIGVDSSETAIGISEQRLVTLAQKSSNCVRQPALISDATTTVEETPRFLGFAVMAARSDIKESSQ